MLQLTSLDHRGCPSSFLLNWWSGQSTRAEEHREHPLLRQDTGREQSFLSLTRSNPFTMKSQLLPEGAYEVHNHELGLADADTGMMILADTG